jgi:cell division septal protein FtsQ
MTARTHPALARRAKQVAADRVQARRRMAAAVGVAAAGALIGWWLVTGPVLAAQSVRLSGYDGPDKAELERALNDAAGGGSLLRPPIADLRATAQTSAWVNDVIVSRDLPLGIVVEVIPARPVAVVTAPGGVSMLVSARGRVMGPSQGSGTQLPRIQAAVNAPLVAGRAVPAGLAAAVTFTASLEAPLAARVRALRVVEGGRLEGRLGTEGPRLIIGSPQRLSAKAVALGTLVDNVAPEDITAATYIDLTLPERPTTCCTAETAAEPTAVAATTP